MVRQVLLMLLVLGLPASAKDVFPVLTSADGSKKIHAIPIAVDADKVVLRTAEGKTITTQLDFFSATDRAQLKLWMDACRKDAHAALVQRVKGAETLRVLFVGNSYSFQIPKVFEKLAHSEGKKVEVEQVTKGGWTLAQHANEPETRERISGGGWDVVVLQEQSMVPAFPEPQRAKQMDAAAKQLADAVREAGAIPVFFLTWGRRDGDKQNAAVFPNDTFAAMQKRLIAGYKKSAAQAGGAYVVPVGEVWSVLLKQKNGDGLYSADGSHPGKRGIYLGACVFYSAFYNEEVKNQTRGVKESGPIRGAASAARLVSPPYPVRP